MDETNLMQRLRPVEAMLRSAGQSVLTRFNGRDFVVSAKGPQTLVSGVDRATEAVPRDSLTRAFPADTTLLGEEGGGAVGDLTWVVDPIASTSNFVRAVPHWFLSVGLLHHDRPVLGVIRDPNLNEAFTGIAGVGA